jgi:plasmid stability protein
MAALTIRLPDDKHTRLKALAESRGTPLNKLFDEIATQMLVEFDAEARFKLRAARGTKKLGRGLSLLKKAAGE